MKSKRDVVAFMNALADQVEAFCSEHEAEAHGGNLCIANRMSALGFLAHRLGCKSDTVVHGVAIEDVFVMAVREYDRNCPHCNGEPA